MTASSRGRGSRAVLIGTATYTHNDLAAIPAALNNLTDLSEVLTSAGGAFAPEHCVTLPDPARGDQIGRAVAVAAGEATDVLFVYYTGHGVLDSRGRLHLTVTETDPSHPSWTSVPFQTLREEILESRATARILILDCCYSGLAVEAMSDTASVIAGVTSIHGTYTITSSAANETSLAPLGHRNTAFTAALLAAADTPELTLDELYQRTAQRLLDHGHPRPRRRAIDTAGGLRLLGDTQAHRYRRAADTGDLDAMTNLGFLLEQRGELTDAEFWYRKAATTGDTGGMFLLGYLLKQRGELTDAEEWWRRAAASGELEAMVVLGCELQRRGELTEAEEWWRRAAASGNPRAMHNLGLLHQERGDLADAESWYRRAADTGHLDPMMNLYYLLRERGELTEAESWCRKAADSGDLDAMTDLGILLQQRGELTEAELWYRKAATTGHPDAMTNLGYLLKQRGELTEAESWYRKAATTGHPDAMTNLGVLLKQRGELTEAESWYRRAADTGHPRAMFNLGVLLEQRGELTEAESWYRRAADTGHPRAMNNLGNLLKKPVTPPVLNRETDGHARPIGQRWRFRPLGRP